jgi:hypothetical protein
VIRATVPASRVLHRADARHEFELVIAGARNAVADGTPAEWETWIDEWRERTNALQEQEVAAMKARLKAA